MLSLCLLPQGTHALTWKPLSWSRMSCMCWSWSWRHWSWTASTSLMWCSSCWHQAPGAARSGSGRSSSGGSVHTHVHMCAYCSHSPLHPFTARLDALCFSHVVSMPLLPQSTHALTWRLLSWARRSCMCWSWSWRPWSWTASTSLMWCSSCWHAAGTRSTKEWQWQKQLRWECACTCTNTYTCVHVLIA